MKKYLIREIGWAFNDSEYFRDGDYGVVDLFDDYDSALTCKKALERKSFLNIFPTFLDTYIFSDDNHVYKDRAASKLKFHQYLVKELYVNPTLVLHADKWAFEYEKDMFIVPPTDEQVDKMIEITELSFYKIIEVEEESWTTFYKAYPNKNYSGYKNYFFYGRYDGGDKIFNTPLEAMEAFKKEKYLEWFKNKTNKFALISGTLTDITHVPPICHDFIIKNAFLTYADEQLRIPYETDADTLLQLNEMLIDPFLQYEVVNFDYQSKLYSPSEGRYFNKEDQLQFIKKLEEKERKTIEEIKNSDDYIRWFYFNLSRAYEGSKYSNLVKTYLPSAKNLTSYPSMGVIKKVENVNEQLMVTATFGNYQEYNYDKEGIGIGDRLEEAFYKSLKDWLDKYSKDLK